MKTLRLLSVALILGGVTAVRAAAIPRNGIAVIVNDAIITFQDVQMLVEPVMLTVDRQFALQPATPERMTARDKRLADIERDGLEQLINRQLVLSEYKTKGYNLPETLINEEVERRIREKFSGSRVDFIKTLKGEGTTYEYFRRRMRDDFIYSAMRFKNVGQDLIISPAKIERYYEAHKEKFQVEDQVKLRTIVLNRTRLDDADTTRKRAEEILFKINEGADFGQMAQVNSEGSQRAQGGDWGWVERSVPVKEIADVAFSLQAGQHSGVVETPGFYYIILVEDKRTAHMKPVSEARDEIEKVLLGQEQARLEKAWLERLKTKAFVRFF